MSPRTFIPLALVALSLLSGVALHADAPPETAKAFDRYVALTDARVKAEMADGTRFLWMDFLPDARRRAVQSQLTSGQIVLEAMTTLERGREVPVPGGVVHHWVGTVFVPKAHVRDAVALMQDYDRHEKVFAPMIAKSRLVSRNGDTFHFTMRFVLRKVITAVLQTDQEATFFTPAPDRAHSRLHSTRIVEIDNAGTPQETEKTPDRDRGYLWQQVSYWRYIERDGGTYIQCESMSLSRPLPFGVNWLFGRAAAGVPRDTLSDSLAAARKDLSR
jgi:hypothetical protein